MNKIVEDYMASTWPDAKVGLAPTIEQVSEGIYVEKTLIILTDGTKVWLMAATDRAGQPYAINVRCNGWIANHNGWAPYSQDAYQGIAQCPSGKLADEIQGLCRVLSSKFCLNH